MINLTVINLPCNEFTSNEITYDKFTTQWFYQESYSTYLYRIDGRVG